MSSSAPPPRPQTSREGPFLTRRRALIGGGGLAAAGLAGYGVSWLTSGASGESVLATPGRVPSRFALASYLGPARTGVVSLPPGSYSASHLPAAPNRAEWLVLRAAQGPGTVTVTDLCQLTNQSRVAFVGINFLRNVVVGTSRKVDTTEPSASASPESPGAATGSPTGSTSPVALFREHDYCDRIVLWYCDVQQPRRTTSLPTGSTGSQGVKVFPASTNIWLLGTHVHDTSSDGIRCDGGDLHVHGCRQWAAQLVGTDHVDGLQMTAGTLDLRDTVFGVPADTAPDRFASFSATTAGPNNLDRAETRHEGQSDLQIKCHGGPITATLTNVWITNVAGRVPVLVGNSGGYHADCSVDRLRLWANDPVPPTTATEGGGVLREVTPVIEAAPPPGMAAPDVVWRQNNPYDSYPHWLREVVR